MKQLRFKSRHKQRGILGLSLFGDESETESTQTSTQTATTDRALTSIATGEQTGVTTTQLLSPEVQSALEQLVLNIAGTGAEDTNADDISSIAQFLLERAQGAADEIRLSTDAIIADERRIAERELRSIETQIGQSGGGVGAGSSSFVAGATAEGRAALETGLARLSAELDIQARGVETSELVQAIQGFSAGAATQATEASAVASLIQQLRGATATTVSEQTSVETQDVNETIDQIVEGLTTAQATTTETPSLFSVVSSFL